MIKIKRLLSGSLFIFILQAVFYIEERCFEMKRNYLLITATVIIASLLIFIAAFVSGMNFGKNQNETNFKTLRTLPAEAVHSTNEHLVDMSQVVNIESDGTSAYLTMEDGTGYYWELGGY